jgi:hypothetical protein
MVRVLTMRLVAKLRSRALLAIGLVACLIGLIQYHLIETSPLLSSLHRKQIVFLEEPAPAIAILLQISPVDPKNRPRRLLAIDQGWSNWLKSNISRIDLYAPSPPAADLPLLNLRLFRVEGADPFSKMLEAFFAIVNNPSSQRYDWLMFGNDHTFVIPQNLRCYLKRLDGSSLVYAGNNLRITFQGRLLRFASGGAGAVLSRPSFLSILSVWTVLHSEMAHGILRRVAPILFAQENIDKFSSKNMTLDLSDGAMSDPQLFHRLLGWTLSNSQFKNQSSPLQVSSVRSLWLKSLTVARFG